MVASQRALPVTPPTFKRATQRHVVKAHLNSCEETFRLGRRNWNVPSVETVKLSQVIYTCQGVVRVLVETVSKAC